jgi:hypothetical protein
LTPDNYVFRDQSFAVSTAFSNKLLTETMMGTLNGASGSVRFICTGIDFSFLFAG